MRIKILLASLMILCVTLFGTQVKAFAPTLKTTTIVTAGGNDSMQIVQMQNRVAEIQNMDVQNMSSDQKHQLRGELKQMLKQARSYNDGGGSGGVYLSIGGLIIIILLLILILR